MYTMFTWIVTSVLGIHTATYSSAVPTGGYTNTIQTESGGDQIGGLLVAPNGGYNIVLQVNSGGTVTINGAFGFVQ